MARKQIQMVRMGLVSALIALGMGAGIAQGSGFDRGDRGHGHRHYDGCGCQVVPVAGFITIDGYQTKIVSGRRMLGQIAGAFRRAGYRAYIRDGCVHVDYGYCKPSVRWHTKEYAANISWKRGGLGLSLRRAHRNHYRPVRVMRPMRPLRPVYRFGTCR